MNGRGCWWPISWEQIKDANIAQSRKQITIKYQINKISCNFNQRIAKYWPNANNVQARKQIPNKYQIIKISRKFPDPFTSINNLHIGQMEYETNKRCKYLQLDQMLYKTKILTKCYTQKILTKCCTKIFIKCNMKQLPINHKCKYLQPFLPRRNQM